MHLLQQRRTTLTRRYIVGSAMIRGGVNNASAHGGASAARAVSGRSKRKSVSLRAFRVAIEDLRESQELALEAAVAKAYERQEEATADLKSMITQLHNQLVDALGNSDGHEEVAGGGSGGGDVEDKASRKDRIAAWKDPTVRKAWLLSGEKPAMTSWTREQLQDVLIDIARVSPAVASQLGSLASLDIGAYMPNGQQKGHDATLLYEHMDIMVDAVLAVVGYGAHSPESTERLRGLRTALDEGATMLRKHCRKYCVTVETSDNRKRMMTLVNDDLKQWTASLFAASVSAGQRFSSPPSIGELPPVVIPVWENLHGYIINGGLMNAQHHAGSGSSGGGKSGSSNGGPSSAKRAKTMRPCFGWSKKEGCRFVNCAFRHDPAKKYGASSAAQSDGDRAPSTGARGSSAGTTARGSSAGTPAGGQARTQGGSTARTAAPRNSP